MKPMPLLLVLAATLPVFLPAQGGNGAPVDMHTSRNSLDWAGTYEGVLPCADCPGIKTRLTLGNDGTFEKQSQYLDRDVVPRTERGRFTWQADGNTIALAGGGGQNFAVGEGRLIQLNSDGTRPEAAASNRVLLLVAPVQAKTGAGLNQVLEDHRWTLESATDGKDRRIDALFPTAGRPFTFTFSESRLFVQGGCNSLRGGYQINAQGQLDAGQMAGTMMACEPGLMKADAALVNLLAQPLRIELLEGAQPQLRLLTAANEILGLKGQITPEALYGPGTIMFLEVDAQRATCKNPWSSETQCLQVRERKFDEQGLRVGTPGAFQPFYETIDGYQHTPGERNVIRVKRFQRSPVPADAPPAVYVLDLMVETETVLK
jgi:heat shock protein HslJ